MKRSNCIFPVARSRWYIGCLWLLAMLVIAGWGELPISEASAESATPTPQAAFDQPGRYSPRDLYRWAHEAFQANDLDGARLLALRVFFDGHRSVNLLNLLGTIEIKAGRPLLATEWLLKALCLDFTNSTARNILARLPGRPIPMPVDPLRFHEHFTAVSRRLPKMLDQLSSPRIHADTIQKEIQRGMFYMGLALAEEYEKKYPGVDGPALTALCAWYLGRNQDTRTLVDNNLGKSPHHHLLLFVKAMLDDTHPETSAPSRLRALYDLDRWQEALDGSKKYTSLFPKSSEGFQLRARIALDLMRTKEAAEALEAAKKCDPGNPEVDLLATELAFLEDDVVGAEQALRRALRRGYHLPSVNLAAGLIAAANQRLAEATTIFQEAAHSLPFSDRSAWPFYIQLALRLDKMREAATALDLWRKRGSIGSEYSYMLGINCFRTNDIKNAIGWINRGFSQNSNRLAILKELLSFPEIHHDQVLVQNIKNKLASAGIKDDSGPAPVLVSPPPGGGRPTPPAAAPATAPGAPSADGLFEITLSVEGGPELRQQLETLLAQINADLEPLLGRMTSPVFVNFVPSAGMGNTIAMFDTNSVGLVITQLVFETDLLRVINQAEKPWMSDEEIEQLIGAQARHQIARELAQLMILRHLSDPMAALRTSNWVIQGLAETLAGSPEVLSARLKGVQKAIEEKKIELGSLSTINQTFSDGYSAPDILDAAYAQAYLMTSFLMKREGTVGEGVQRVLELLKLTSEGTAFDQALQKVFKLSLADFESGWKQAAFWSLRQGTPYSW